MLRKTVKKLGSVCLVAALWLVSAAVAQGAIIINAPMTDTNSSGWVLGGNPTSAVLTGNGAIDSVGNGWLRLTNNTGDQTGFAYNTTSFDLSAGVLIQFDYATWGGSGADGYSVFLFDANVPTFNIGAFGGSLGYAQKSASASCNPAPSNVPGISGGYMGIGVDEFGNFAYGCEGRYGGGSQRANTVTLRGSVYGFGGGAVGQTQRTTSYPWIATSSTSPSSLWYNGASRPTQTGTDYRKVIIRISPAPNPVADVWIQFGYNTAPVQMISGQALPAISASQQLRVGYAASTGGSTNYHEIRNLLITTLDTTSAVDLGITKTAVATGTSTAITSAMVGNSFQYLINARNYGPNAGNAAAAIIDSFPAGVTPGSWTCSATGGASCSASGSGNLATPATLPMNGTVTYRVNATLSSLPAGNLLTNSASVDAAGSDFFPGNDSASSTISAYQTPIVTQSFTPASVPTGTASKLTVTITNPNNIAATGIAFTDSYPSLLLNAGAATTSQCGGTVTAANNGTSLRLTGGSIAANSSCTVTVNVDSTTANSYTIPSSTLGTTNLGNGTVPAATLVVMTRPTLAKSFTPSQVGVNTPSTLTVTLNNPNAAAVTGAAFTDNYPSGLVNSATPNAASSCGGTVTAAAGGGSLALSGGTIPAGGSCTVTVSVTSPSAGSYANTTGSFTTGNSGTGTAASATLTVLNPPTVTKSFSAATILPGGASTLTVTLTNPNATAITGAAFSDSYPTGLVNTAGAVEATTCAGGTAAATGGGNSLSLTGGTIPAGGSCTVTVPVTSATPGTYVNSTGAISTGNAGSAPAASGTLTVMTPPTATKAFSPNQIAINGTTTLTVTLSNPNPVAITGAGFTDSYPSGMQNKAVPGVVNSCGGSVTAAANGGSLALSGGTIPAGGSCGVSVNVTITATGDYTNTTGSITTGNAGSGTAASANLNGPQPPTVAQAFSPASVPLTGSSTLTVTLSNPNSFAITGTAFTDSYPAGLVNTGTPAAGTTCGGTVTAAANGSSLALSGGTIPAGGSCSVSVNVAGSAAGSYNNSTGQVTSANTSAGTAASATLTVMAPPTATLAFAPASVLVNTPSVLTITLSNPNPNATALTGVGFTDSYPAGLVNSGTPAPSTTCSGATVTAAAGGGSLTLSGATIPPSGSCSVSVNVTSAAAGSYLDSTGAIASGNAGSGAAASATLTTTLLPAPGVAMNFAPDPVALNGSSLLTVTLTNGSSTAITGAAFSDSYPSGMVNSATPSASTSCGGTVTAPANGGSLVLSGATIPAGGSCSVTVNVTSAGAGIFNDSTGPVTSSNASPGAAASDTLTVLAPPTASAAFAPATAVVNSSSLFTVTLSNPNAAPITGAAFSASYPSGLVNTGTPAASTTCGGTVTAAANGTSLALSGGSIPAGGSCTVTVNTTSATVGSYATSTGPVSTTYAGSGSAASATLTTILQAAPTAVKAFAPTQIAKNGTSTLSVTLSNPNSIDVTGVAFSDTLPSSPGQMSIAASSVLTSSCGGTGTIAGNKLSFSISGGTIPAGGSCTVSVTVTAGTLGTYNNTTSTVTSSNSITGAAASASLTVALLAPPAVAKSFTPNQMGIGDSSVLTITLSNPNSSAITGAAFTDSYPGGLVNTSSPGGSTTCSGGSVTAAAGAATLALTGASIPANSSCSVTVNVTSAAAGTYLNTTGTVTTTNASSGSSASATLNVLQAPSATKAFLPAAVAPGVTSVLTVTLRNPNSIAVTGVGFSDSYPSGLVNTASAGGATTCTGGTVSAANNGNSLGLSGATIPGGSSCTVTVNVKASGAGSYLNSIASFTSSNAGTGAAASGTLVVMAAPSVAKSFSPAAVQTGTASTLTITLSNPNPAAVTGAGFTDSYPANLANTATPGAASSCGGTVSAAAGGGSLALSGGTVPANGSCTVSASVTSLTPGAYNNSTGAVATGNAGSGTAASATLGVYSPPTVAKSFGVAAIPAGGSASLRLTLANPSANLGAISGVQVDDGFPAGLTLQNTSFGFTPAGCGSVTKASGAASAAGDSAVRFSVASLAAGGSCQVSLNVTSSTVGPLTNTTGAPAAGGPATLAGSGASAGLSVSPVPLLSILKSADQASATPGQTVVYTVQVANSGAGAGTNVVLSDDLSPYGWFFLGGGTPFSFTDSAPASGLTLGTPQYSRDNGTSWVYTPVSGAGGAPAGYDGNVTNWRVPMNGSIRSGGSFMLNYQIQVK